jgi:uncharacterized protein YprB with RNaseH-like and TPR domain
MKFEVNGNEFKVCMSLFEFGMRFAYYKGINKPFKDVSINYDNDNLVIVKFDTECHGLSREEVAEILTVNCEYIVDKVVVLNFGNSIYLGGL